MCGVSFASKMVAMRRAAIGIETVTGGRVAANFDSLVFM